MHSHSDITKFILEKLSDHREVRKSVLSRQSVDIPISQVNANLKELGITFADDLSDEEKRSLEAVLLAVQTELTSKHAKKIKELKTRLEGLKKHINIFPTSIEKDKSNKLESLEKQKEKKQSDLEILKSSQKEKEASDLATVKQSAKEIKIDDVHSALNPTSLPKFIAHLKKNNIQYNSGTYLPGEYTRFFDKLPMPSYLMPLIEEAIGIIKTIPENTTPEQIQQKFTPWFQNILNQSKKDLFDNEGNIRKDLYELLPEALRIGTDPEKEKKLLLTTYLAYIGRILADIAEKECPDQANMRVEWTSHRGNSFEAPAMTLINGFINSLAEVKTEAGYEPEPKLSDEEKFKFLPPSQKIPFLLSHVKIEDIEKVITNAIPNKKKRAAFQKDFLDYQISHAAQVQRWQEELRTKDLSLNTQQIENNKKTLIKKLEKEGDWRKKIKSFDPEKASSAVIQKNKDFYEKIIKPRLEKNIEQHVLAEAEKELKDARKIEKAKVTLELIKSIKELIIANAKKDAWTYKPAAFFAGETIREDLGKVPKNIAAIYKLCLKAEKNKAINNNETTKIAEAKKLFVAKEILDIYKEIETIGVKASHSFFAPLKAKTKEFYEKLDRSHQERMAYKASKGKKTS